MTVDCMACLVATARMRAADPGREIIFEGVTHSTYFNAYYDEHLTCRPYAISSRVTFSMRWLDAVTRAARGLPPRSH